ncbi:MAG: glycosyltransferase [Thaumarchaeota archaeon]|nr:glycosyltransferase [Nitrososphaerota archaeon]
MKKIGQFIYSWGNGHYSRMMSLNEELPNFIKEYESHYTSKDEIYQKLLQKFPANNVHEALAPTPLDGKYGPDVFKSMVNTLLPIQGHQPIVKQVASYLRKERELFDSIKFDLVKQIAKAEKIAVADSPPPHTICEYNLNFPESLKHKVVYVGHFASDKNKKSATKSDLEKLIEGQKFGYWMRTGNKSTNDITGKKYEEAFSQIKNEKRIISHARADPSIDTVRSSDGKTYSISEALEKKIDWVQIDVGFLSESEKENVLERCDYAVINGSHTVMGEIIGIKGKPIIGIPVYDEQTNQIQWAQEHKLGILANNTKQLVSGIAKLKSNYSDYEQAVSEYQKHFVANGARTTAKLAAQMLESR